MSVKLDKKSGVGQLSCKVCNQQFQCAVNCTLRPCLAVGMKDSANVVWADLSAAVDVYSDWVDACDAVAKEDVEERGGGDFAPSRLAAGRPSGGRARDDDEDLEDLIDDEGEDAGGYGGEGIAGDDEY